MHFETLNLARKGCVSPFPAIFALGNSRVHVGTLYSSNMASYIEAMVNKNFSRCTALEVPDVDPHRSDLGDALMTLGLEAKEMSLKKSIFFKIVSTMLELIGVLPSFK